MKISKDIIRSQNSLGISIREQRKAKGLTQADLAQRAGLRQATISGVEKGVHSIRLENLLNILRILNLELSLQARSQNDAKTIETLFA